MVYEQRQQGNQRWGLYVEFPLEDNKGRIIHGDRRTLVDRRESSASSDDLAILFSQMPANDTEH